MQEWKWSWRCKTFVKKMSRSGRSCHGDEALGGGADVSEGIAGEQEQAVAVLLGVDEGLNVGFVDPVDFADLKATLSFPAQFKLDGMAFGELLQPHKVGVAVGHDEGGLSDRFATGIISEPLLIRAVEHELVDPGRRNTKPRIRFSALAGGAVAAGIPFCDGGPVVPDPLDAPSSGSGRNGQTHHQQNDPPSTLHGFLSGRPAHPATAQDR